MFLSPSVTVSEINAVARTHLADCLARMNSQKFSDDADDARRLSVVEKLQAELVKISTTPKDTQA